jgi:transcriptional regulator with XRE-family HTH domain
VQLTKLAEVRQRKLLSQAELAERAGVSKNTIHRLENGISEAQGRTIRKLADALGVAPAQLIDGAGAEPPPTTPGGAPGP